MEGTGVTNGERRAKQKDKYVHINGYRVSEVVKHQEKERNGKTYLLLLTTAIFIVL